MANHETNLEKTIKNYRKAFKKLDEAVQRTQNKADIIRSEQFEEDRLLKDVIKDAVIHRFEYTHKLACNVMKDFLEDAKNNNIYGPKDATREAFSAGLIENGDAWMDMIGSRNKTSHTYNEEAADSIFLKIVKEYIIEFSRFYTKMDSLRENRN
jgi:nucleotidyltransferase substrate binding protein (TIGR01987 family)